MTLHDTLKALKEQIEAQDDGVKAIRGFDILASKCGDAYMKGQLVALDGLGEMVPDLEWHTCEMGHLHSGIYEINPESYELFVYDMHIGNVTEDALADMKPFGTYAGTENAKSAASAHHRATLLKALGVTG